MQRIILNIIRKLEGGDPNQWFKGGMPIITPGDTNCLIRDAVLAGRPFMVGRLGSVEIKPLLYFSLLQRMSYLKKASLYVKGEIDYVFDENSYQSYMMGLMGNNAGFFPDDVALLKPFADMMATDVGMMDLCGCWLNEKLLKDLFSPSVQYCNLGSLEPYDYDVPWSSALKGKKVLVIHPFESSIRAQYERRELLWDNKDVLPEFELKSIKAVQSIAGQDTGFKSWFEALESMERKMDSMDFDVALIGCGAYGLPLAAHAKRLGKVAIHLGGPLQILFGIKGKRWDELPAVSRFYNEYWVRPSADETPVSNNKVENGCYW